MADRTSAALFASLFEFLAQDGPLDRATMARKLWWESMDYDFDPSQMGCYRALMKLGLARMGVNPKYPEDGEVILYGPEGNK